MRALYQAGVESCAGKESNSTSGSAAQTITMDLLGNTDRESLALLNDCVRQASIVKQLSQASETRAQLSVLQALIGILGFSDQVIVAEAHTACVLDRIAADISRSSPLR